MLYLELWIFSKHKQVGIIMIKLSCVTFSLNSISGSSLIQRTTNLLDQPVNFSMKFSINFLINPSANVFVFGDFNVHLQDCLTYSGVTDRPVELFYNKSQITLLRWLTFFLGSLMTFPSLENSDHFVVSVSIDFPINSKQDALFHLRAYDYSHAYWELMYFSLIVSVRSNLTHHHGFQQLALVP